MGSKRLIPVVTIVGEQAVKTCKFDSPKYVGDPVNTTALFSSFEVEELIVLDISKNFNSRSVRESILNQIVENAFMPITFGGGVNSMQYARKIFEIGFDKVLLRTSLFEGNLAREIADEFGSQAITGCLDVIYPEGKVGSIIINGREYDFEGWKTLLEEIAKMGVGELIIQDVEREGTRLGLRNHRILKEAIKYLEIPVVPLGGCQTVEEAASFLSDSQCHSIAASTMFLFRPTRDAILVNYPQITQWQSMLGKKSET